MKTDILSGSNPLRGLDLFRLVDLIEQGEKGYYAELMWLYRLVLKRNGVARAVRRKLTGAIGRLDWMVKIPEGLEGTRLAAAERQRDVLRKHYDAVRNLRSAYTHMAHADIMGFSHLEKVYAREGEDPWMIQELRVVPQWHLCRDGLFSPWQYNADARNTNRGATMDLRHWIVREIDDPAAEVFSIAHLKMSTTDADWDQYCDTYAVPPLFVGMPPNVRKEDEAEYQKTAEAVVSDGRGALPHGATIHSVGSGSDGVSVFVERLRYYREEIVLAGTGGILSTLDGNTGIGKGPAEEHDDAWLDIAAQIGLSISETMQEQFDRPLLERLYPDEEILAYWELDKPERGLDAGAIFALAANAAQAGMAMDAEEIAEKSGWKVIAAVSAAVPTQGAPVADVAPPIAPPVVAPEELPMPKLPPPSARGEADPALVAVALANDLGLEARWLAPVDSIFREIEALIADPAVPVEVIEQRLADAIAAMPEMLGNLDVSELANALEAASGPAAIQGLADGLRAKAIPTRAKRPKKAPKTTQPL